MKASKRKGTSLWFVVSMTSFSLFRDLSTQITVELLDHLRIDVVFENLLLMLVDMLNFCVL
jgi:hypothetical protein